MHAYKKLAKQRECVWVRL